MRHVLGILVAFGLLWPSLGRAGFDYAALSATGIVVTGIRSDSLSTDTVVVTGSLVQGSDSTAALYRGPLSGIAAAPLAAWTVLAPVLPGLTVTASTFYGPNTPRFDPVLGPGGVRAVGSFKFAESPAGAAADHGLLYQGPVAGGGSWSQIDATPLVPAGHQLLNTIAHSTMGNLVVGNYDTTLVLGRAFIHDVSTGTWVDLNPMGALSVTAYGIWQNGGPDSTRYTIAGGFSTLNDKGVDAGYLVDYDAADGSFSNLKTFRFRNLPVGAVVSHFDGISGVPGGYTLTGEYLVGTEAGGFLAEVIRRPDGSFTDAVWRPVNVPGAMLTTGNTVIERSVLGIFTDEDGTRSYIATAVVPAPAALPVFGLALLGLAAVSRRAAPARPCSAG